MLDDILKLTTIATSLKGNKLRLTGETTAIVTIAIHNDTPDHSARMLMELSLPDPEDPCETACDCKRCSDNLEVKSADPFRVYQLISAGRHKKLLMDSLAACEGGFAVKIRNTATRRCDVGEGSTIVLATARAVNKAMHL